MVTLYLTRFISIILGTIGSLVFLILGLVLLSYWPYIISLLLREPRNLWYWGDNCLLIIVLCGTCYLLGQAVRYIKLTVQAILTLRVIEKNDHKAEKKLPELLL